MSVISLRLGLITIHRSLTEVRAAFLKKMAVIGLTKARSLPHRKQGWGKQLNGFTHRILLSQHLMDLEGKVR